MKMILSGKIWFWNQGSIKWKILSLFSWDFIWGQSKDIMILSFHIPKKRLFLTRINIWRGRLESHGYRIDFLSRRKRNFLLKMRLFGPRFFETNDSSWEQTDENTLIISTKIIVMFCQISIACPLGISRGQTYLFFF